MNYVLCNNCGDVIHSGGTHDMVACMCGDVRVDGGEEYLRVLAKRSEDYSVVTAECVSKLKLLSAYSVCEGRYDLYLLHDYNSRNIGYALDQIKDPPYPDVEYNLRLRLGNQVCQYYADGVDMIKATVVSACLMDDLTFSAWAQTLYTLEGAAVGGGI